MAESTSSLMESNVTQHADASSLLLLQTMQKYWGYEQFRPLQLDAIHSVMQGRDSLVVFPTGAGKSLCYQIPALCLDGLAVVVSPLISLMKDQVDALQANGVPAACLNSHCSDQQRRRVSNEIQQDRLKLLYLAPERLLTEATLNFLQSTRISMFAIDESHCVSEWGHDFRPEYRGLAVLKQRFPQAAVHAYTATATPHVQQDIVQQLRLTDPSILLGEMDRPNLCYNIGRRRSGMDQIIQVLNRHRDESGIIYCISRKKVDSTSGALQSLGYRALPYHAGMSAEDRRRHQEAFLREEAQIIVATVAFGMGIDKSNVRFVIHAAMPKSIEAYQQESGRAGRDGLDADCWMFYSGSDFNTWKRLLDESDSPTGRVGKKKSLEAMYAFCQGSECRHRALLGHFGQPCAADNCQACDICNAHAVGVDDALVVAQKILSCVLRTQQRFGADYVAQVLIGSQDRRIIQHEHHLLSTYGLLLESRETVRGWIEQLIQQDFLRRSGEYNVLQVSDLGRAVLRGERTPRLVRSGEKEPAAQFQGSSWEGVDRGLFQALRELRANVAAREEKSADALFSDASLRDMARRRPSTPEAFHLVLGVSQQKLTAYGPAFVEQIVSYSNAHQLELDIQPALRRTAAEPPSIPASAAASFGHFDQGRAVPEIARILGRAESTVRGYLEAYIQFRGITDATRWVTADTIEAIKAAMQAHGAHALKPIYVALHEKVSYDDIRIVVACSRQRG